MATYQTTLDCLPLATLQSYGNSKPLLSKFNTMIASNEIVLLEATRCPTCGSGLLQNHAKLQTETIAGTHAALQYAINEYKERILEITEEDLNNLREGYKALEAAVREGAKDFVCEEAEE
jgi:hypothetical protein